MFSVTRSKATLITWAGNTPNMFEMITKISPGIKYQRYFQKYLFKKARSIMVGSPEVGKTESPEAKSTVKVGKSESSNVSETNWF